MIKHICPFCNIELSFDCESSIHYYKCINKNCELSPYSRYTFTYMDDDLLYREVIMEIDNCIYQLACSYTTKVSTLEKLKFVNSSNYFLPASLMSIENFTIPKSDDVESLKKIAQKFLNLKAFL